MRCWSMILSDSAPNFSQISKAISSNAVHKWLEFTYGQLKALFTI